MVIIGLIVFLMLIYKYIATLANINKKPNNRGDKIQRKKEIGEIS